MHVHCGSRDFEGDVGVESGRRRPLPATFMDVELMRPLPPRLPPPRSKPPRPAPTRALLSSRREYEELAFRENLNAGDCAQEIKTLENNVKARKNNAVGLRVVGVNEFEWPWTGLLPASAWLS